MSMILCFSGGLDSLIAWHFLDKPKSIYFNCAKYSNAELEAVKFLNPDCIISEALNLREFEEGKNAYILHRNLLMAAIASNFGTDVVIAGLKDDVVEDKNPKAFNMMSNVLSKTSKKNINIISPFWGMTKSDIVNWFINNHDEAEYLMKRSVSCYNGVSYCGECPSCFRKANALWDNGIKYKFFNLIMMGKYWVKASEGKYIPERNRSIIRFVEEYKQWISM